MNGNNNDRRSAAGDPITPELLAESILAAIKLIRQPKAAESALFGLARKGDLTASLCLATLPCGDDSPQEDIDATYSNVRAAANAGDEYAMHVFGASELFVGRTENGLRFLRAASDAGVAEATWELVSHFAVTRDAQAFPHLEEALRSDHVTVRYYALCGLGIARMSAQACAEEYQPRVRSLETERNRLSADLATIRSRSESERLTHQKQLAEAESRKKELERTLADFRADALRDEVLARHKSRITEVEEELLNAQVALEEAQARLVKQESLIDDLKRNCRHLAGLLRKNAISFIERSWGVQSDEAA